MGMDVGQVQDWFRGGFEFLVADQMLTSVV
jgi:hypothetical protein